MHRRSEDKLSVSDQSHIFAQLMRSQAEQVEHEDRKDSAATSALYVDASESESVTLD